MGIAAIGIGIAIYGTVESSQQQRKTAREQRKARALQQKQSDITSARTRTATIREARIKRAQVQASAQAQGAGGSSGVAGGLASLQTQAFSQIGSTFQAQAMGAAVTSRLNKAAGFTAAAGEARAVSQIGMTIFSNSERISSIFK